MLRLQDVPLLKRMLERPHVDVGVEVRWIGYRRDVPESGHAGDCAQRGIAVEIPRGAVDSNVELKAGSPHVAARDGDGGVATAGSVREVAIVLKSGLVADEFQCAGSRPPEKVIVVVIAQATRVVAQH